MKTKMFSVFDVKAACYGTPFFMPREQMAIRTFADAVNEVSNPNNNWAKHPEDFSLFYIGDFDDDLATFDSLKPVCLVTAAALKSLRPGNIPPEIIDTALNGRSLTGVK